MKKLIYLLGLAMLMAVAACSGSAEKKKSDIRVLYHSGSSSQRKTRVYVGAITDEHPRTATIPFSFLPEGRKYIVTVYADGRDADWKDNPQSYDIRRGIVTSKSVLRQPLASSGGWLSVFEKQQKKR